MYPFSPLRPLGPLGSLRQRSNGKTVLAKKSLEAHNECNVKKKWNTHCVFETPKRWEPIVVTGHFAFLYTLQYIWEVIFPFWHTLHGF